MLVGFAILIGAIFGAAHLAGLREDVSVLSGTIPESASSMDTAAVGAGLYLVSYFSWVLGAPILLIAAVFLKVLRRSGKIP